MVRSLQSALPKDYLLCVALFTVKGNTSQPFCDLHLHGGRTTFHSSTKVLRLGNKRDCCKRRKHDKLTEKIWQEQVISSELSNCSLRLPLKTSNERIARNRLRETGVRYATMVTRRRKRKSDLVDNFLPASQQRGLDTDLALSVLFEFLLLINANSFFFPFWYWNAYDLFVVQGFCFIPYFSFY